MRWLVLFLFLASARAFGSQQGSAVSVTPRHRLHCVNMRLGEGLDKLLAVPPTDIKMRVKLQLRGDSVATAQFRADLKKVRGGERERAREREREGGRKTAGFAGGRGPWSEQPFAAMLLPAATLWPGPVCNKAVDDELSMLPCIPTPNSNITLTCAVTADVNPLIPSPHPL